MTVKFLLLTCINYWWIWTTNVDSGLWQDHFEISIPIQSPELSDVELVQYLDGWPLRNIRRCKLACAVRVNDNGSELLIWKLSSSSSWFMHIHLRTNTLGKDMKSSLSPFIYGLTSKTCITKSLLSPKDLLHPKCIFWL